MLLADAEWLELAALDDEIVEDAALIIHGRMPIRPDAPALSDLESSVRLVLRSVALAVRANVIAAAPPGSIFARPAGPDVGGDC